jgi:hypothetical protein
MLSIFCSSRTGQGATCSAGNLRGQHDIAVAQAFPGRQLPVELAHDKTSTILKMATEQFFRLITKNVKYVVQKCVCYFLWKDNHLQIRCNNAIKKCTDNQLNFFPAVPFV